MYQAPTDDESNEVSEGPVRSTVIPMIEAGNDIPEVTTPSDGLSSLKKNKITEDPSGLTVSEIWKKTTGMSWSEAKKMGLTDGSYSKNMELRKRLLEGNIDKKSSGTKTAKASAAAKPAQSTQQGPAPRVGTKDYYKNMTSQWGYTEPAAEEQLPDQINDYDMEGNPIYVDNKGNKYLYKDGKKVNPKDVTYDTMRGAGTGQYYRDLTSQWGASAPEAEEQLPDQINDYDSEGNAIYIDSKGKKYQYYGNTKVHPGTTLPYNQKLISGSNTPGAEPKKGLGDYYQERKKAQQAKPKEKGMLEKAGDVFSEFYRNNPWMRKHGGSHMRMYQPGGITGSGGIDVNTIRTNIESMGADAAAGYLNELGDSALAVVLQQDPDILNNVNTSLLEGRSKMIAQNYAQKMSEEGGGLPTWAYGVIGGATPAALYGAGLLASQGMGPLLAPIDATAFNTGRLQLAPYVTRAFQQGIPFEQAIQYPIGQLSGRGVPDISIDWDAQKRIQKQLFEQTASNFKKLKKSYLKYNTNIPFEVERNLKHQAGLAAIMDIQATSLKGQEAAKNFMRVAQTRKFAGTSIDEISRLWIEEESKMSNLSKAGTLVGKPSRATLVGAAFSALGAIGGTLYGKYQNDKKKAQTLLDMQEAALRGSSALLDSNGVVTNQAATLAPGSSPVDTSKTQTTGQPKGYTVNGTNYMFDTNTGFYMAPDSTVIDPNYIPEGAQAIYRRGGVNQQGPLGYGAYNVVFMDGGESAGPGFYTPDSVIDEKKNALMDFVESQKQIYQMRYGGSNFSKKKKN
jgi:hypothetical protein